MALSDKEISALYFEALGSQHLREQDRKMVTRFAHAVESEGMENSKRWMQNMLDQCVTDTLVWYIPMIGGRYIIEIEDKTYTSDVVHSETDRVLGAMGFKRIKSIH